MKNENENNGKSVEKTKEEIIDDELDKRLEQYVIRRQKAEMRRRCVDILTEGTKWGMKRGMK